MFDGISLIFCAICIFGDDESVRVEMQLLHDGVDLGTHWRVDLSPSAQNPNVIWNSLWEEIKHSVKCIGIISYISDSYLQTIKKLI